MASSARVNERWRHCEIKRFGGLELDDQIELDWLTSHRGRSRGRPLARGFGMCGSIRALGIRQIGFVTRPFRDYAAAEWLGPYRVSS